MKNRTVEGHWWRPGHENEKVAGIATFDGADLSLRLLGAFMKPAAPGRVPTRSIDRIPFLYGSGEGQLVTLLDAHTSNLNIKSAAATDFRHTFSVGMMLVGIWLDHPDDQRFESMSVEIDNLLEWAARSGWQGRLEQREQGGFRFSSSWSSTDNVMAQVADAKISLGLTGSTNHRTRVDGVESTIAERACFGVTPAQLVSAKEAIERWARPLQDLLSFAMDAPCALGDIELHYKRLATLEPAPALEPAALESAAADAPEVEPAEATEPMGMRRLDVQVYFAALFPSRPGAKPVYGHDALFRANDAPFETLLPAWFEARERFGPVIDMLLGLRYVERTHIDNRVITSVAAAEGLHRRLLPDERYVPEEEFEALTTSLIAALPDQHQQWLRSRLWNEPSLKQRLEQLVACLPPGVTEPFLPTPNRWARRTTDTRNWLAHRFEMSKPPNSGEKYVLHQLTSAVVRLVLMQELGLDEAHLTRIAMDQKSFEQLAGEGPRLAPRVFDAPGAPGPSNAAPQLE